MTEFLFGICVGGLLMLLADAIDNIREERYLHKKNREKRREDYEKENED